MEDAKTPAGWRKVPIHSKLAPTMARLLDASRKAKDEYVLAGLTLNNDPTPSASVYHTAGKPIGIPLKNKSFLEIGVPTGIRTPVAAVRGRCPRPLDDGDVFGARSALCRNSGRGASTFFGDSHGHRAKRIAPFIKAMRRHVDSLSLQDTDDHPGHVRLKRRNPVCG